MVKTLTAWTDEIDDAKYAVQQIQEQIDFDNDLLANSVGLISCLPEYGETGVLQAICEALPFDIVGTTTIGTTATGVEDLTALTLTVLTADDVTFKAAWTEPIVSEDASIVQTSFEQTAAGSGEPLKLIIAYAPLLMTIGGDFFNKAINQAGGGAPCFGALTVDDTADYHNSRAIFNGQLSADRLAYVLVYGNVEPQFYLATISQEKISKDKGVVTKSRGNLVMEINGKPVSEFLLNQGMMLNEAGEFLGINSFPYIVDFKDGADPVVRVMLAITPDGDVICGGDIPEGAVLSIGYFDREEILKSTADSVKKIKINPDTQGIIAYSCVGRYFNLGFEPEDESQKLRSYLENSGTLFQFTYVGGELCPIHAISDSEQMANRYHNCTMIACVF